MTAATMTTSDLWTGNVAGSRRNAPGNDFGASQPRSLNWRGGEQRMKMKIKIRKVEPVKATLIPDDS